MSVLSVRRTLLSVMLVGGCIWCLGIVQQVYSEEKAGDKAGAAVYKPVAPVEDIMHAQQYHFGEIRDQFKTKEKDKGPNFKLIRYHANVLAELCNVNHYQKDKGDYKKWADEARDLCLQLAKVAKDKESDKVQAQIKKVHAKCTECHDKYQ